MVERRRNSSFQAELGTGCIGMHDANVIEDEVEMFWPETGF